MQPHETSEGNMNFDDHQERFKIKITSSIVKQWLFKNWKHNEEF
jgi:hypothetical protein